MGFGKQRRYSITLVAAIAAMTLSAAMASSASAAPDADQNGCTGTINSPHYSSGAGGVIAKGRWSCTDVPSTVYLGTASTGFYLWKCPGESLSNCTLEGINEDNISVTVSGKTYTLYVPPSSSSGAKGSGYWIAEATWYSHGPKGSSSDRTIYSPWWKGSS
jgi:hypothetical protein